MKRKGPESATPPDTGPFRKMEYADDTSEEGVALKKMETEIAAEGKFSIRLPEDIKYQDTVPFFEDALKNPAIGPKDVVFYSLATGVLKYNSVISHPSGPGGGMKQEKTYIYKSKNNPHIELKIWVEKNKATFADITTKIDAEKIKEDKEKRDWLATNYELKDNIGKIKKMIKAGINMELDDLKNNVESFLQTINDELEKKKK